MKLDVKLGRATLSLHTSPQYTELGSRSRAPGPPSPRSSSSSSTKMERFVGKKKDKKPVATLDDTSKRLEGRGESIDVKIARLDKELVGYKKQLKSAKGASAARIKQKALAVLKKKKMYEKQRDQLSNQAFNVDQQAFMIESVKDAQETVATMKQTKKAMKGAMKKINIDKIDDLQYDMEDMMYDHEELQDVMGRALGFDEDLDEGELDDELAALDDLDLEDLEEDEGEADYLKSSKLPSAPTFMVDGKADSGAKDKNGLPAMPLFD